MVVGALLVVLHQMLILWAIIRRQKRGYSLTGIIISACPMLIKRKKKTESIRIFPVLVVLAIFGITETVPCVKIY
jgi:hypothetical protein